MATIITKSSVKSPLVTMLSDPDLEGYTEKFVIPSAGSGATIGNGIDLSKQSPKDLLMAGVSTQIVYKIKKSGLYGKKGAEASKVLALLGNFLTPEEVIELSNKVTERSAQAVRSSFGEGKWKSFTPSQQAIAIGIAHQYGLEGFKKTNSFKQFQTSDWSGLKTNLSNWGDTSKGVSDSINKRYGRLASKIKPVQQSTRMAYP